MCVCQISEEITQQGQIYHLEILVTHSTIQNRNVIYESYVTHL